MTTNPAAMTHLNSEARRTYELDREHVFRPWVAQSGLDPLVFKSAEGSYLLGGDGKRYLDLSSQLVNMNIGHSHPRVVEAIKTQAELLCMVAPYHAVETRSECARLLAVLTPGDLNKIFFTNGGSDANEHAVRMARLFTGRNKVLTTYRSYHGGTSTAVNMSGDPRRWLNDHGTTGTLHFWGPFLYRSAFHSTNEAEECERALSHLEQLIVFEGADTIAAIVLEPVPGSSGVIVPPVGYLRGVRELCDRYGIIFIADEVMTGFGRTGNWFEISDHDVVPDLLTFAKGVNSGYIPLGGVAIGDKVSSYFETRAYPGGLTYSGHPLATAAAIANINAMRDEGLIDNAKRLGEDIIGPKLAEIGDRHPSVGDVRGKGCMWALDLVTNPELKTPLAPHGGTHEALGHLAGRLREQGVLPFTFHNRMHIAPPLNTYDADLDSALDLIDEALKITDEYVEAS